MTPHAQDTDKWIEYLREVSPRTYLDIGAGDGFDCAQIKAAFPECRCVAIEPFEAWEVDGEIEKHRDVIGSTNGYTLFHIKDNPGVHGMYSRLALTTTEVLARKLLTLQRFCEREGVEAIDAMKIDVEGAAWDVLAGSGPLLDRVKMIHVETEWVELFEGQRLESEVFLLLKDAGFQKVYTHRVEELGQGDSIWVRQ